MGLGASRPRISACYPDQSELSGCACLLLQCSRCPGRPKEARVQIERALELDPLNPLFRSLNGVDLILERRYAEAIAQFHEALRLAPNAPIALQMVATALHDQGRYAEALEAQHRAQVAWRDGEVEDALTQGFAVGGYQGAMRRVAETLSRRPFTANYGPFMVGLLFLYAGDKERALEWMERAYSERDPNLPYLTLPEFDSVRADPRFRDLVKRMRLPG